MDFGTTAVVIACLVVAGVVSFVLSRRRRPRPQHDRRRRPQLDVPAPRVLLGDGLGPATDSTAVVVDPALTQGLDLDARPAPPGPAASRPGHRPGRGHRDGRPRR